MGSGQRWSRVRFAIMVTTVALALAACGGDDDGATTLATTTSTSSTTTTSTTVVATTTTLPGTPVDFGPDAGDVLAVVGVAHDDVLNVRALPGTVHDVVATLAPTADDVVARGNTRQLPRSFWYEVEVDGVAGWVGSSFVAYAGDTIDDTAQVVAVLGEIPVAETMADLGQLVAEALASDDPPSRIVMSVAPTGGDLGEVTYDVIGLGDDSVAGLRLHVFGAPQDDGFSLETVETTLLCGRGVSDGLCV